MLSIIPPRSSSSCNFMSNLISDQLDSYLSYPVEKRKKWRAKTRKHSCDREYIDLDLIPCCYLRISSPYLLKIFSFKI